MSIVNVLDIASSGMAAQSVRMNTIASNLANAETVAGSFEDAYRALRPVFVENKTDVFTSQLEGILEGSNEDAFLNGGVSIKEIVKSDKPVSMRYEPEHPLANEEGYIFTSNVNPVEEMADMIATQRSFQINAEVANTAKSMTQRLLTLGQ